MSHPSSPGTLGPGKVMFPPSPGKGKGAPVSPNGSTSTGKLESPGLGITHSLASSDLFLFSWLLLGKKGV
jgi:hypothetical protein